MGEPISENMSMIAEKALATSNGMMELSSLEIGPKADKMDQERSLTKMEITGTDSG